MLLYRASRFPIYRGTICTIISLCLIVLSSCVQSSPAPSSATPPPATAVIPPATIMPTTTNTVNTTPQQYTSHVLLSGTARPDDLTFDRQGHLLFSDFYSGKISRINADGSVTVLLKGLAGPEGLVVLSDGTLIIAEQHTNSILSFAP